MSRQSPRSRLPCRAPARERGAVLIVSLILLVVMTLLGVTSMNSTSLEEKMAANTQITTRAFQTAETGLSIAFNDNDAYDLSGAYDPASSTVSGTSDVVDLEGDFKGWSPPPSGSLYSATSFQAAHFDFTSVGQVGGGSNTVSTTLHGGAYQIAPKQN